MKVRTRAAVEPCAADCGHHVAPGHAVVRRGKRWVCTRCSLPDGQGMARCPCGALMRPGQRIALRADGRWCHQGCCPGRPLALASVTDGYETALESNDMKESRYG